MDLSKKPELAAEILRIGQASKVEGSDKMTVAMLQRKHNTGLSDAEKAKMVKFAQDVLSTDEGKSVLAAAEVRHLDDVEAAVKRVGDGADPRAAKMTGALEGQLRITGYVNQFGTDVRELTKLTRGKTATIGKTDANPNSVQVKLDGEMTPEWFDKTYVGQTKYGQENPKAIQTRIDRANSFDLGPQTMAGLGRAIEKIGPDKFARKFAIDNFRQFAARLDNGVERYENLPAALDASIGRLDRNAPASFQDYLNVARENLPAHVRYPALKRDGWVGPKTADAFKTALYAMGPKNIADDLEGVFGL